MDMKVSTLADKAMLVKLTMRRANLTSRDAEAESVIQSQMDDQSLIVNRKLFRDKANPINKILTATSQIYQYHKKHTLPYIDKGPRILPNGQYFEYTQHMRGLIGDVDNMLKQSMPNYDTYVQMDIAYRSQKPNSRALVSDYPTADEFEAKMGYDIRFSPMPESRHFLFDINDEDLAAFDTALEQAAQLARSDYVSRMLKPLSHLVEKLTKPIGTDNSIFRDTAVENVLEGIEIARRLCIDDSPEMQELTNKLDATIAQYSNNLEWLRESPIVRERASKELSQIAEAMGAFMGAA